MRHVLMAAAAGVGLMAVPARADYSKGQELTILALHSAVLASQHCPYALDERALQGFLSRKGLKRSDLDAGRYSPLLTDDMAADDGRYASDTAAACDQAWASFGPGGPMKGILRAR